MGKFKVAKSGTSGQVGGNRENRRFFRLLIPKPEHVPRSVRVRDPSFLVVFIRSAFIVV
jgi:hypothetical protein